MLAAVAGLFMIEPLTSRPFCQWAKIGDRASYLEIHANKQQLSPDFQKIIVC